jgi:hypothetical protein
LRQSGGRVLRIEVVAHNVKDLRGGKVLDKLPELLKRMREMLVRFLGTVQAAHVAFLDEGTFERWSKPTQHGTRRLAGIYLNKARNRHVVDAVVALVHAARRLHLYSARNAAYDLAKLKGKKLVDRVEGSRRYKADPSRVRAMCAYHPARQDHQTTACRCRASRWPSTQNPSPGRSALRPAPRGAQPNLRNHRARASMT